MTKCHSDTKAILKLQGLFWSLESFPAAALGVCKTSLVWVSITLPLELPPNSAALLPAVPLKLHHKLLPALDSASSVGRKNFEPFLLQHRKKCPVSNIWAVSRVSALSPDILCCHNPQREKKKPSTHKITTNLMLRC